MSNRIASGAISLPAAIVVSILLSILAFSLSLYVNFNSFIVILIYILINIAYSLYLKNIVILDVFIIAVGFILRVVAGSVSIDVRISNWIILCTFFVSLLFGFGKRRCELIVLKNESAHRPVLNQYNLQILDFLIIISVSLAIITYSLYVIIDTVARLGTNLFLYTIPLVLYGIFKYMHSLFRNGNEGDPADIILKDKSIIITVLLWTILVIFILYFNEGGIIS